MKIAVFDSSEQIAEVAADFYSELLSSNPQAVLGLATGSSPVPLYNELIRRHRAGQISFAQAKAFLLDEYIGLAAAHPEAYRNFIDRVFVGHVDFAPGAVQGPDGTASDIDEAAAEYEQAIEDAGWVDLQLLGIGTDGHIAFNEPGGSLSSPVHSQSLVEQTRADNARFFEGDISQVPKMALTQGLGTISKAKKVLLIAEGEQKAEAIAQLVEGAVSALWPATVLQFHGDTTVLVDEGAASKLRLREHYDSDWNAR